MTYYDDELLFIKIRNREKLLTKEINYLVEKYKVDEITEHLENGFDKIKVIISIHNEYYYFEYFYSQYVKERRLLSMFATSMVQNKMKNIIEDNGVYAKIC